MALDHILHTYCKPPNIHYRKGGKYLNIFIKNKKFIGVLGKRHLTRSSDTISNNRLSKIIKNTNKL